LGQRDAGERQRGRTKQSFCVPKADIAGNGYDLSINRYKEVVHEATEHLPPKEILKKLAVLEAEIQAGMKRSTFERGCFVVADEAGYATTELVPLRCKPNEVHPEYLAYFLRSSNFLKFANMVVAGAKMPRMVMTEFWDFLVPIPPLPEQRRIAAILDQADALRAKRREALAQLDSLTQSIFIEMFGDPVTNPKGWPIASLQELMDASGPQNGLYKPSTDYGTGTPILRIDAFYDGKVTKLDTLKRVRLSDTELNLYRLCEDDIVINRVNSIEYLGKSALIPPLAEATVFESNMMRFNVRRGVVSPIYVVQFLQTKFIKNQILSCSKNAVNQSSINQQDVKGFQLNVPPLHLQQAFATRIQSVEALKVTHNAALQELDRLFASLQHRAFQGEL
jgi:type I restriction enzyme S subunit